MADSPAPKPFRPVAGGVAVALRVTPNAGFDRIEGAETRDDGTAVLRVRVRAQPERGAANAAVIKLLAGALGLPKSALVLVSGEAGRLKTVRISGDQAALAGAMDRICAAVRRIPPENRGEPAEIQQNSLHKHR